MLPVCKILACLFVTVATYPALFVASALFQLFRTDLPDGIDQPLKLLFFQTVLFSVFGLGFILEKLGLYTFLGVLRLATNGFPLLWDSALLIQNLHFDGVRVRVYQPKNNKSKKRRAVLFFHGGAGTYGCIDTYERILRHIAKESNSVVVAVGYHLGPENPYPNQYKECLKATVHFMKHVEDYHVDPSRIIISGDSCGANFATRICQLLVDRNDLPKVHAQILIYPAVQAMDLSLPSYQQNRRVPFLWPELVVYFCCRYLNKNVSIIKDVLKNRHVPEDIRQKYGKWVNADHIPDEFKARGYKAEDPATRTFEPKVYEEFKQVFEETFSPIFAEDATIRKLPQTLIVTCEFDVLRDDGLLYKKRLEDNGVPVTWLHSKAGVHAVAIFFGCGPFSFPSSRQIVQGVTKFIRDL